MDHQGDYVERVTDETPEHQPDAERAAQQEAADAGQGDPPAALETPATPGVAHEGFAEDAVRRAREDDQPL